MSKVSVSLVVTVLNEAETISALLTSIKRQYLPPNEVVITDGDSSDNTQKIIQEFSQKNPQLKIRLINTQGNRSLGRNEAINQSRYDLIAITDAGCVLEPDWLSELVACQSKTQAEVVAGYYHGQAKSSFQTALIPYALVMPDKLPKVGKGVFLPATRSMLILKSTWQKAGQFNPKLNHNEDFAFAQALIKIQAKFAFCPTAIVSWQPPSNIFAAAKMFYRFALGDAEARIFRPKVGLIFGRYLFGLIFVWWLTKYFQNWLALGLIIGLVSYLGWAILKNFRYVKSAWPWLPLLQVTSDLAVIVGTTLGSLKPK